MSKETLIIGAEQVVIDSENLNFNETTLNDYIIKEGGFYDNFGGYLAKAEKLLHENDSKLEEIYAERFAYFKDQGGSDKLCEARTKSDGDYLKMKEKVIEAKYLVTRLKNHLRSWDKNHDNAQSLGHMIRKEMDKLHFDIRGDSSYDYETKIDQLVGHIDTKINE